MKKQPKISSPSSIIDHGIVMEIVWQVQSSMITAQLGDFWLAHGALGSREATQDRSRDVVCIARDRRAKIVGVSSVTKRYVHQLASWMWFYRTFTHKNQRQSQIATRLTVGTRDFLAAEFAAGKNPEVVGLYVSVESPGIREHRNQGVWPNSRFVFVGYNQQGHHQRVFYFEDARIPVAPPVAS